MSLLFVVSVSKSAPTIQTSLPLKKSHSLQHADTYSKTSSDSQDRSHVVEERYVCASLVGYGKVAPLCMEALCHSWQSARWQSVAVLL